MFQPVKFARSNVEAPNRFLRSATAMFFCDPAGHPRFPEAEEYYGRLAAGGVGTIVIEHAYVEARGAANDTQLGISDDSHIADHARLVAKIKEASPRCVAICQLAHAGSQAMDKATAVDIDTATPQQIEEVVAAFAAAAVRALRAGYDGVQIHCAHGYFLCSTVSPAQNRRTDECGPATLERPPKILDMVIDAVRASLSAAGAPDDFLVGIKLHSNEFQGSRPGITPALAASVAKHIAPRMSFIEISGGAPPGDPENPLRSLRTGKDRFYYKDVVEAFKEQGVMEMTTVIATGGFRALKDYEEALEAGAAIVGASRPFLRNINFVKDFEDGREGPLCINCCQCFTMVPKIGRAGCVFADKVAN